MIVLKFKMCWFFDEVNFCVEELYIDIKVIFFMIDEDDKFGGCLF